jgi:hypothetical protein
MTDSITKLLTAKTPGITDDLGEFSQAIAQVAAGKGTFGEALNRMRAGELKQAQVRQDLEMAPKKFALEERRVDLSERQVDLEWEKLERARTSKDTPKYVKNAADFLASEFESVKNLSPEHRRALRSDLANDERLENPINKDGADYTTIRRVVAEHAQKYRPQSEKKEAWGPITYNENVGKYYQENLSTGELEWTTPETAEYASVTLLLPDDTRATGRERNGELSYLTGYDNDGKPIWKPAPPGTTPIGIKSDVGATGDIVSIRKFRGNKVAMKNMVDMASGVLTFLQDPNFIAGIGGATVRVLNSLRSQSESIGRAYQRLGGTHEDSAGNDISLSQLLDPSRYKSDILRDLAGTNVRAQSALIGIAYMLARSQDPSGRLSDQDVERALDQLGANSNDPVIIQQTVTDAVWRAWYNFQNEAEEMEISPDEADFGLDKFPKSEPRKPSADASTMSSDELWRLFE